MLGPEHALLSRFIDRQQRHRLLPPSEQLMIKAQLSVATGSTDVQAVLTAAATPPAQDAVPAPARGCSGGIPGELQQLANMLAAARVAAPAPSAPLPADGKAERSAHASGGPGGRLGSSGSAGTGSSGSQGGSGGRKRARGRSGSPTSDMASH